jgi:hypothetical protein
MPSPLFRCPSNLLNDEPLMTALSLRPFGNPVGDPALALAEANLVRKAVSFVTQGLQDTMGSRLTVSLHLFEQAARGALLDIACGDGLAPRPDRLGQAGSPDCKLKAFTGLVHAYADAANVHAIDAPMPLLGELDARAEGACVQAVMGKAPLVRPELEPSLEQAYRMSIFNMQRCEQRLALLYALGGVRRQAPGCDDEAQRQRSQAARELQVRRTRHLARALALGALMGERAAAENRALAKKLYREGVSVIELVQVDGLTPTRWPAATEDALREAIAAA